MDNHSKIVDSVDHIKNEMTCVKSKVGQIKKATKKMKKENVAQSNKEPRVDNEAPEASKDVPEVSESFSEEYEAPSSTSEAPANQDREEELDEDDRKFKIPWIGTYISKALNKDKLENDINAKVKMTKAYCIKEEENARYKNTNFKAIVPEVVKKETPEMLVLQTGSIEITNINVDEAIMDVSKDVNEYKREWFEKVEQDSKNLLDIEE